jgi:hypothetical protein
MMTPQTERKNVVETGIFEFVDGSKPVFCPSVVTTAIRRGVSRVRTNLRSSCPDKKDGSFWIAVPGCV